MRILLIGGTRFVGLHMAAAALARGHQVSVFHRGRTGRDALPGAEHLLGDRDADLTALDGRDWDATIDVCAYLPGQVRRLAGTLGERAGHYALVSSVSAYATPRAGFTEDAPLATPPAEEVTEVTPQTYGGLKVACERAALAAFGPGSLLIRPSYVVGPGDYTWRFPAWVSRVAAGGEVLAPGPADDPSQLVDARDMADWVVRLLERGVSGAFHAASPAPPWSWADTLGAVVDAVGPAGTRLTWVDAGFLREAGVGEVDFPLWAGGDEDRFMLAADPSAAFGSGLSPRPLAETIHDVAAWVRADQGEAPAPAVSRQREADLLRAWHAAGH